ncbi:cordon-bleu protein-like 1 isoform X3 [Bubalus bubalis]|nr:cordon-bleu protein-like 1 isoform X3 [Bubalus bubalis]XP_044790491.1 cordon-bleu protein-like 1 isoform X3 [Bubalus bubalis]XP_044790493.1 cordon-bleu protein-like 1 isoform X3 [Bubalus bubalis]XP_044790495.1 cordon-bleu protein-like 1 isoform X3 [Bubalus bubalis]XP_044790496.1 cordon-bleu protein-like 1 isoform X3 [Bubalus bubalis]
MDGRAPRVQDAPAALPPATPAGRKPKAKAPLPPAETKCLDASSVDDSVESSAFIMDQKENMTDKDIELLVVLPGDIIKSTTVNGSKPMMDLLIFLCAQYHLNPSSHTIDLLSAEKNPIKFKPNTPIGMLEVEQVILKPKILDKKKPTPLIPEKTVRVVINFKKTQKTIVRVSPHAPLQELITIICSKCEFDPLHTQLLKDYQSQEPLDLTKSLNELGLRELYAIDVSKATSVTAFNKSSLQESCQISQNLDLMKDKESKGFFSLFQRSKKKREQTVSAPATPLVSKHRPTFTKSNTISKQYISNTLPSDAPKKRRAPLPPMPGSQSSPQDPAHIQERPASCMVKSPSVDETEESSYGAGRVRTGSLQLSSTSAGNSSLKRTKRKAPSPPSKTVLLQSDENSHVTATQSVPAVPTDSGVEVSSSEGLSSPEASLGPGNEQCAVPQLPAEAPVSGCPGTPEAAATSLPSGISSDYSLEEIDEKEELSEMPKDEAENTSLKSQDIPTVSTDIINTLKNDPDSAPGSATGESSQNSKEEKQGTRNTDEQRPHIMVCNSSDKETVVDSVRNLKSLDPNQEKADQHEIIVIPTNTENNMKNGVRRTEINVAGVAKNNVDIEVERLSNYQAYKTDTAGRYKENHLAVSSAPDQNLIQPSAEKTKMQDAAIQTIPSCGSFDGDQQDHNLSDVKVDESVQTSSNNKSTQHLSLSPQDSIDISGEFRSKGPLVVHTEEQLAIKDPTCAHGNDNLLPPVDGTDKNPTASYVKNYPFYRQDYNPKPKPSNEITREYIPKIGMTTYKIVPPRSLEISKDRESETIGYKNDQEIHTLGKKDTYENVKETTIQTEDLVISESPKESQADLKSKPTLKTEHQMQSDESFTRSRMVNPLKPPRMTSDTGTAPFAPKLEDINNILESKFKSRVSNPHSKPSAFFLQMQKRVSDHYVSSAAAKSVQAASNPTPKELKKEVERDKIPPLEPALSPLSKTIQSLPQPHVQNTDDDSNQKPTETSSPVAFPPPPPPPPPAVASPLSPPPVASPLSPPPMPFPLPPPPVASPLSPPPVASPLTPPPVASPLPSPPVASPVPPPPVASKPVPLPKSQLATLNLKTLKTFGAPRPYSSSAPSPFALAVVKRSQSFSKSPTESCSEEVKGASARTPTDAEKGKIPSVNTFGNMPQLGVSDKENNSAHNEQNPQIPSPTDCPSFTLKRQSSSTFQSSDPEQIRQSLLTAIRSGEAAAKLKRVTVQSNTIYVNGKSRLSRSTSLDAPGNH